MPYVITQCYLEYLPPGSGDFPAFTPAESAAPEGYKAKLTWVVVISEDSLLVKYGHLSQR